MISSRKAENVAKTVDILKTMNLDVIGIPCHVGKDEDRKNLIQETLKHYGGRIDVLVSNAASNPGTSDDLSCGLLYLPLSHDISCGLLYQPLAFCLYPGSQGTLVQVFNIQEIRCHCDLDHDHFGGRAWSFGRRCVSFPLALLAIFVSFHQVGRFFAAGIHMRSHIVLVLMFCQHSACVAAVMYLAADEHIVNTACVLQLP